MSVKKWVLKTRTKIGSLKMYYLKYLIGRKQAGKNDEFFDEDYFYRLLIFTDEYSYRHFFYKREHLLFSSLKIPLFYLFDFQFD